MDSFGQSNICLPNMDVDNVFNMLGHKACPVGVFPIGVVTSSQLGCGY